MNFAICVYFYGLVRYEISFLFNVSTYSRMTRKDVVLCSIEGFMSWAVKESFRGRASSKLILLIEDYEKQAFFICGLTFTCGSCIIRSWTCILTVNRVNIIKAPRKEPVSGRFIQYKTVSVDLIIDFMNMYNSCKVKCVLYTLLFPQRTTALHSNALWLLY